MQFPLDAVFVAMIAFVAAGMNRDLVTWTLATGFGYGILLATVIYQLFPHLIELL